MAAAAPRGALGTTLVATAVDTVGVLPIYLVGAMAVQLQAAIQLEIESLGLVFAAYFAAAALLSAPVGRLTDRIDPAAFLWTGCVICLIAILWMSLIHSVGALVLLAVVSGIATAFTRTTSSMLVARGIPSQRQGLALGVRNCAIPAAALLSGLAVPAVALTVGWRWAFVVAAGLVLGLFVVLPRSVPRSSQPVGAMNQPDMEPGSLAGLAVAGALASTAAVSLGAYTALTAVEAGMSEGAAGILIATGSLVGVVSRIGVGWWTDRRPGSQLDVVIGMILIGAIGYGLISLQVEPLLWAAVPAAYATGWAFYGSYYLSVIRLNPAATGSAVGKAQSGAFAGSIVGPIALGTLASRATFSTAWLAAMLAAAAAAVTITVVELSVRKTAEST